MNKRHYEHTLPNIRGSLSNTYVCSADDDSCTMPLSSQNAASLNLTTPEG